MGQPCSKVLRASIRLWLPFAVDVPKEISRDLLAMSPATLDRLLKPVRFRFKRRGLSTTKPAKLLRTHIPLRDGPANPQELGHIEADTVAHCGDTTAGDFVYSLVFTDGCTGWTEIRATWNKSARGILEQLKDIVMGLPSRPAAQGEVHSQPSLPKERSCACGAEELDACARALRLGAF